MHRLANKCWQLVPVAGAWLLLPERAVAQAIDAATLPRDLSLRGMFLYVPKSKNARGGLRP